MPEQDLSTELTMLKGVGNRMAPAYAKLGLHTVGDLLYHLPRRYEDRRNLPKIGDLRPGDWATVKGRVRNFEARPTRGGMVVLKAVVGDGTGAIALTWFNQPWIRRQLEGYDEIGVDHVMETLVKDNYRMQTLITEIATSYPFVNRRTQEPEVSSNGK